MKTIQMEQILGDQQLVLIMLSLGCLLDIHVDRLCSELDVQVYNSGERTMLVLSMYRLYLKPWN